MQPEMLFPVALVLFFGVMCLALLVFGVFVFAFFKNVSNFGQTLTAEFPVPSAQEFLTATVLRPWEANAFSDLSCHWKGDWRTLTRLGRYEGYARGVIQSHRNPEGPGWIAFTIDSDNRQERDGKIVLMTSTRRVELKVSGERLSLTMRARAEVDGKEWGAMRVTYPACLYQSVDGATTARWEPVFKSKRSWAFTALWVSDPDYYPLLVNDRHVAALADLWIRNPRPDAPKPLPAALQSVNNSLTDTEQGILLMMLGMSLYFETLRPHRLRYDW
jgi:hypothetical protein